MKFENPQNKGNGTPQNSTVIEVPNVPVFARLERRTNGIYVTLFSKAGPCPFPPCKMRVSGWEEAKLSAREMLTGLNRIMSTPLARAAAASIAKLFVK